MRVLPVLAGLVLGAHSVSAQTWVTESRSQRLAWGNVNVLITADSSRGLRLWVMTSPLQSGTPRRVFVARFDPDSMTPWVATARGVLSAARDRSDSGQRRETPVLQSTDGSAIALARPADGTGWPPLAQIYFLHRSSPSSWYLEAPEKDAKRLLALLLQQSQLSRIQPEAPPDIFEPNPMDSAACPTLLTGNPQPAFPSGAPPGEVWLTFVVQADGTTDPTSFHVWLSDGTALTRAAVQALSRSRFTPAHIGGSAVAARVYQRVTFRH